MPDEMGAAGQPGSPDDLLSRRSRVRVALGAHMVLSPIRSINSRRFAPAAAARTLQGRGAPLGQCDPLPPVAADRIRASYLARTRPIGFGMDCPEFLVSPILIRHASPQGAAVSSVSCLSRVRIVCLSSALSQRSLRRIPQMGS